MAEKKATSRKRSTTTKSSKSTRSPAKPAAKRRTATKTAPVQYKYTPVVQMPAIAPPTAPEPDVAPEPRVAPAPRAVRSAPVGDQPSRFTGDHYLHATAPSAGDAKTPRPGKWLIFVSRRRVDALWGTIRGAVERGRLGHAAKVSTALPEPNARDRKKHVIAVYTGDENDAVDVRRVRDALRGLGVTWRIPYKSDAAALAGQNDEMAGGPATKYYE